jgi:uncharacterized protein (TIGR02611 family)
MRLAKIVVGFGLLGCGIAMLALPGPGWLTIAAALAILAAEFRWARRALDRLKAVFKRGSGYGSDARQTNRQSRE